ncbi:ABC Superfamily [Phytophthora cinnamomi]|uniref:ABC Superfamily n=1 Tax=Phytophthora cinnamomi TaxID=4785 RepID=UPI00355A2912|nr:ABC Superfamily [Phytophthora cinnamomi]
MPPKRSSRGAKASSKPRAERPKAKKAKAKNESVALKEATGAAAKEWDNPRFSYERRSPRWGWDSPEYSCTKVVYSGESSQEEEKSSEGSAQAANDKKQAKGDVPNAPVDLDTRAEEPSSGKTGTEPMAAPPVKNLTLAEGLARAQAAKAAAAEEGDAPGGKKRTASKSPPRDDYRGLFDDSESEEGAVDEPREISNDLDEQQAQYYSAGAAARAGQATAPTTATLLKKLTPPRGPVSGYTSKGAYERALVETEPLFVSDIEAARCVLLALHKIPLKEFANLRKKAEDMGGLHPVWGYP